MTGAGAPAQAAGDHPSKMSRYMVLSGGCRASVDSVPVLFLSVLEARIDNNPSARYRRQCACACEYVCVCVDIQIRTKTVYYFTCIIVLRALFLIFKPVKGTDLVPGYFGT